MYSRERLQLLSDSEIETIYAIPEFNAFERSLYFTLTDEEMLMVKEYRTVKAQVYFICAIGYFKAKQQIYKFLLEEMSEDTNYILKKYFKEGKVLKSGELDLKTYNKQKSDLLALFRYKDWKSRYEYQAQSRLSDLLRLYPKGHDTFRQLMIYFEHNQLIAPSYRTIQDMFTKAYSKEDERLHNLIAAIPKEQKTQADYAH